MKRGALLCALAAFAATACNTPEFEQIVDSYVDIHIQESEPLVDVLFVIDNSLSMEDEQEKLAANFDSFIQSFFIAGTQYHVGVITTDREVGDGRLQGDPLFIRPETPDAADAFRNNVRVGIDGSGHERGLSATARALSPDLHNGWNQGFRRDIAKLVLVYVSDENDHSGGSVGQYLELFQEYKDNDHDKLMVSALIGLGDDGEPGDCGGEFPDGAEAGWRYWDLAQVTGGFAGSICAEDFAGIVGAIGQAASGMISVFPLQEEPDAETLEVRLFVPGTPAFFGEGYVVPPEGFEGNWAWELVQTEDGWALWFPDPAQVPPPETRVEIRYDGVPLSFGGSDDETTTL